MRFSTPMRLFAFLTVLALFLSVGLLAQETTGGLQGTVKDATGAVIGGAHVVVRGTTLVGEKSLDTDSTGYYRFANLPPGNYSIDVSAKGFKSVRREGLALEVGHLPTVDMTLEVGTSSEVIEVTGAAPVVDVTTNTSQTNLTNDLIENTPHGYSFQSVIQYAPMARNEPLAGGAGGTGGSMPGSTSSGAANGYSIGGAADTESTYLVEGQDTENISMGFSNANVPFDFIQEVQVKTSGIEAEHGGALGGVVNVVMKKGGNSYHGSIFGTYESDAMDGSATSYLRYDPFNLANEGFDNNSQIYQRKKDHFRYAQPGFGLGGPIMKDRLWFFVGFAPLYRSTGRTVNFGAPICTAYANQLGGAPTDYCPLFNLGNQLFTQDSQQYFGTSRLDFTLTSKIRLFGSWLYQYWRETGANLPNQDPVSSEAPYLINTSILGTTLNSFSHGLGFSSPNSNYNVGADITLTPKIVATTRLGYYFTNYHDFGWPTSGTDIVWDTAGTTNDNSGAPLPSGLALGAGAFTTPYNGSYTLFNASKHWQFNQDVAFFKSGWAGTHNIKVGYQFNRMSNIINQNGNVPHLDLVLGAGQDYAPSTTTGAANCGDPTLGTGLAGEWGVCAGQYGYAQFTDFATVLTKPAYDNNHAFFVQDAWTVGHGLTLNLGIRIEKENLPVPAGVVVPAGFAKPNAINFQWSDKIEPRLGAAWGSANGKLKIFGSYGVVNDVMKLLLAQTSWGAQGYNVCTYPLGPDASGGFNVSDVTSVFVNGRACPNGLPTTGTNFAGGTVPQIFTDAGTGTQLIENVDYRPWEPVAPGVKPYRQHEYVAGVDYQVNKNWALEARYDRRRLDHVIEDASLSDPHNFEFYTIVNPGQGVNKTFDGYANFLRSIGPAYGVPDPSFAFDPTNTFGSCPSCPMPVARRDYDGFEIRLTKAPSRGLAGMFSYTWSRLYGNYTGLTTTDQIDGGTTGRASPNTTRAFDEPFYYYTSQGKLGDGPLPTDRPNTLKGNMYYSLPWKGMSTTFGLFQVAYQGTPLSSASEIGIRNTGPIEDTYLFGRGKWVNVDQGAAPGQITFGNPYTKRTPWFTQTDFNLGHTFKVNKNNEHQLLEFQATVTNLLNQRSPVSYWETFASYWNPSGIYPIGACGAGGIQGKCTVFRGAAFYQAAETGYNPIAGQNGSFIVNSEYGKPNIWQRSRALRLGAKFTF